MDRLTSFSMGVLLMSFVAQWRQGDSRVMTAPDVINCPSYNSSAPCLSADRNIVCLTNGTTVNGFCKAQAAVCLENATVSQSIDPCTTSQQQTTPDPNVANQLEVAVAHVIFLVTSSLCVWAVFTTEFLPHC